MRNIDIVKLVNSGKLDIKTVKTLIITFISRSFMKKN